MFFLETKDGDKFFTDANSDDKLEFEKIIDAKLGRSAAELFDSLIEDAKSAGESLQEQTARRLKGCIDDLDGALNAKEIDLPRLEEILSDLQAIYNMIS